ncbi:ribonuclease Y-like isoform X2 [Morone saxatilis]|uniref:ribonuclease Y-like isoform X2 n=1 Tax=Morone saxatilis TaxID=34816 RepID=UPI0015E25300|nr:ribonuclease Y-like isoform X2 [Morone saxatilis]
MVCLNYGLFLKRKLSPLSLVVLTHCCAGSSVPLKSGRDAAADIFTPPSCCAYCSVVGLGSGLAGGFVLVIAALIVWKWKKSKISKRKGSADKEAQLRKESQKTQEELDYCGVVLSQLLELTSGLGKQKEEFRLQLEEIEKEREENKDKLNAVEKEIKQSEKEKATDKTEGYLKEQQHLLNAESKLDKRKENLEKQQLDVERLLKKTKALMAKATERKTKAENHMQLIQLHLEELESDDDKSHLHRE